MLNTSDNDMQTLPVAGMQCLPKAFFRTVA